MQADDHRRLGDLSDIRIRLPGKAEQRRAIADLRDMARHTPTLSPLIAEDNPQRALIVAALGLSPFLRDLALADPDLLVQVLEEPPAAILSTTIQSARDAWRPEEGGGRPSDAMLMARLRKAKRSVAFTLGLADLAGLFDASETTFWLSNFADAAVAATIDHLLAGAIEDGRMTGGLAAEPAVGSGVVVLGMGKHGAGELNYSSDIDLVIFYDPDNGRYPDPDAVPDLFARLLRRLIRILQERSGDGYVFRTDLRLRPDPGATPLAIPIDAALLYYEGRGQNWERAAFIKARPVAGDLVAGAAFLRELTPFVYRKYLDYAAIADIHSIKRQIHAHRGHGEIKVKGHNIKLGRGGIREIEFFVQTQQLIAGGRMPGLRLRRTDAMLAGLAEAGWIDAETAGELTDAYWFLRDVEHRLQMVHDEQTHTLPTGEAELKRIALMMGFADTKGFAKTLSTVLETVERRYAQLFEQEARLSTDSGNLVFTGQADDPETLETLSTLGFARPHDVARTVRTWHYGRYRATQSVEARERLTELTPELLRIFGQARQADEALFSFDRFLSGLPAGIQLFSLIGNNPSLLRLIVTILSAAPRLAAIIAARPHVFDGLLDPGQLAQMPDRRDLQRRIEAFAGAARDYQDRLDRLRIIASEQRFLIGVGLLTGAIDGQEAGHLFTDLADIILAVALEAVMAEVAASHGAFPGGRVAVIGMGKLGSRELTAGSDVDLILLYDHDEKAAVSDGAKPLDASRYFTRITQRLIAALSAPTGEGVLYEVDMRLRPSGNKGPVATRIGAFARYQRSEAWTWEHMALTRARAICGEASLIAEAEGVFAEIIGLERDVPAIARDVAEMRALIDAEKPPRDGWDFKLLPGGLVDIEFVAQYLALTAGAREHRATDTGSDTQGTLQRLGPSVLAADDLETLLTAHSLFSDLSQIIRLCIDGGFEPADAPAGLIERLLAVGDHPDIAVLEADIARLSAEARRIFLATVAAG